MSTMNLSDSFETLHLIDQAIPLADQLSFDTSLSSSIPPKTLIVRFWTTEGILFGRLDSLLPRFDEGVAYFHDRSIETLVRKAGGLAVACDEGVLNLSLLYSKHHAEFGGLNESYAFGVDLMKHLLQDLSLDIHEGEIIHSYCPGKYDLSVDGKKFAGMAQYRTKDAVMLMITIFVDGDQKRRSDWIRDFYAIANPLNDPAYPCVESDAMKTLTELSQTEVSVPSLKQRMVKTLASFGLRIESR
jgi:lipoate-protein ligase A